MKKHPPQDMLEAAQRVLRNAYAPYSHFPVAACIRAENDLLFAGCNVENASFPIGTCAEGGAISAMVTQGHYRIEEILVLVSSPKICPPCGACRQRLVEFALPSLPIHLCTTDGEYVQFTLNELMPMAFGPQQLEKK